MLTQQEGGSEGPGVWKELTRKAVLEFLYQGTEVLEAYLLLQQSLTHPNSHTI